MIPPKSDPRWSRMLNNIGKVPVNNLSTRMLMSRLKVMTLDKADTARQHAIEVAYEFFLKNEAIVQDDIRQLLAQ